MRDEGRTTAPIAVIGVGNVLLGDDGFGPYVIELLRSRWEFPASVELIDAGTPSLDLASYCRGRDVTILLDAVAARAEPGEIRLYSGEELRGLPMSQRVSPHDPAVQEALWIAELDGGGPRDVLLIGAVPRSTDIGTELSPKLRESAEAAAALVVEHLARHGAPPQPRPEPARSQAWWTRGRSAALAPSRS
jgi:hydrogenase maturation protease